VSSKKRDASPTTPEAESLDSTVSSFNAVEAAAELEEALDQGTMSDDLDATIADMGTGGAVRTDYASVLEAELIELQGLLAVKDKEVAEANQLAERAKSDVTAAQARLERDAKQAAERRLEKILRGFIEVLDDLDRALASALEMDHNPAVVEGVQLVQQKFLTHLREFGVEKRPALGQEFDPTWHEAMGTAPAKDPDQVNKVLQVLSEAYAIGDSPLREARVLVGKKE